MRHFKMAHYEAFSFVDLYDETLLLHTYSQPHLSKFQNFEYIKVVVY